LVAAPAFGGVLERLRRLAAFDREVERLLLRIGGSGLTKSSADSFFLKSLSPVAASFSEALGFSASVLGRAPAFAEDRPPRESLFFFDAESKRLNDLMTSVSVFQIGFRGTHRFRQLFAGFRENPQISTFF